MLVASFSPRSNIQVRKPFTATPFDASLKWVGISNQVKLEIGYEIAPGALVIDTR